MTEQYDQRCINRLCSDDLERAMGVQTYTFGHPPEDSIASSVQLVPEQVNGMGVVPKARTQVNSIQMSLQANALDPGATQDITVGIYDGTRTLIVQSDPVTYSNGNPPSPSSAQPALALQTFALQNAVTLLAGQLYYLFVHASALNGVSALTVFFYQHVQPSSALTLQRWASNNQPVPPQVIPFPADFAFSTTTQWMQAIWLD